MGWALLPSPCDVMKIKKYLAKLRINFKTLKHPEVYTCEEAKKYSKDIRGIHSKNLFLKDKKSKNFYLVILPANKNLEIKKIEKIFIHKIKFADEIDLKNILSITKGSVSPLSLINDKELKVKVIIDKVVWDSNFVSFHPNINTETLELNKVDFHKFIKSLKNELILI